LKSEIIFYDIVTMQMEHSQCHIWPNWDRQTHQTWNDYRADYSAFTTSQNGKNIWMHLCSSVNTV